MNKTFLIFFKCTLFAFIVVTLTQSCSSETDEMLLKQSGMSKAQYANLKLYAQSKGVDLSFSEEDSGFYNYDELKDVIDRLSSMKIIVKEEASVPRLRNSSEYGGGSITKQYEIEIAGSTSCQIYLSITASWSMVDGRVSASFVPSASRGNFAVANNGRNVEVFSNRTMISQEMIFTLDAIEMRKVVILTIYNWGSGELELG